MLYSKFILRISDCIHSEAGFGAILGCLVLSYISGYEGMLFLLLSVVLLDAFWGIVVSIKRGQFARSDLMRQTIVKLGAYGTVMFVFIGMEHILHLDTVLPTAIIVAAISACELWSICGNILIIHPNVPILSLLRFALRGEIARKLQISEENVDSVLTARVEDKKNSKKSK